MAKVDAVTKANIADINGLTLPSAGGFLLDTTYGSGAAVAYSTRKLKTGVTVAARIRRSGDDIEADVEFDSNNEISLTSPISNASSGTYTDLADFVDHTGTARDAFIDEWKDQSGSGNHATQGTEASQPKLYDATTGLITEGGKPAVRFDGSNDYLSLNSTTSTNSVCQIIVTVYDTSLSTLKMPLGGAPVYWQHYSSNNIRIRTASGSFTFNPGVSNGDQYLGFLNANSGAYTAHINGISKATANKGNWYLSEIGRALGNTYAFDNVIQEVILYESDQSSNRTDIETNVNNYFGIY